MDTFDQDLCSGPAEIFKALGHPVRFWIAQQLADGEHCVHEFVERTDLDFSTISQHLNALKQAGIVSGEKRGKQVFYHLDCVCVRDFIRCVTKNIKDGCPRLETTAADGLDRVQ